MHQPLRPSAPLLAGTTVMADPAEKAKTTSLNAEELMELLRDDTDTDECQAGVVTDKVRTCKPACRLCALQARAAALHIWLSCISSCVGAGATQVF